MKKVDESSIGRDAADIILKGIEKKRH